MDKTPLNPQQKALRINFDSSVYGTFAEIGAGQEVARWFSQMGGAAGTVAKTISAYDMVVSDAIYGQTKRYVSRQPSLTVGLLSGSEVQLSSPRVSKGSASTQRLMGL